MGSGLVEVGAGGWRGRRWGVEAAAMHTNERIMSVYERMGDDRLEEHKHRCQATKQDVCSCAEVTLGKGRATLMGIVQRLRLLFRTDITVRLRGNLDSPAISAYVTRSGARTQRPGASILFWLSEIHIPAPKSGTKANQHQRN